MTTAPRCSRCGRALLWARTLPNLRPIALDPEPTEAGVYAVDLDGVPMVTAVRKRRGDETVHFHGPLYRVHAETCGASEADAE